MAIIKNGTVIYAEHPTNHIVPGVTTKYIEEDIDLDNVPLNGGVLIKTLALSSDPYMRYRMRDPSIPMFCPVVPLGQPLDNFGVGTIVRSEDPAFKPGDFVDGFINFQEYSVWPGPPEQQHVLRYLTKIDRAPGLPATIYTGTLGLAGKSAYSAYDVLAKEKSLESKVLFVSGAAGPVGTFVVEYARICNPNLKIIGSAGSAAKIEILKKIGCDVTINYKEQDTAAILKEHGPIDIYWDNTSGATLDAALKNMSFFGLIVACGAISAASNNGDGSIVRNFEEVFQRSIAIRGFVYGMGEPAKVLPEFYEKATKLVLEGKITSREHRFNGLREAGEALEVVHSGKNTGKAVIVVRDE
ncbi:hypothetical protein EW026_g2429 [Hermanssonia centrifuga]|uniref:Enoyl reductase (ER) domain-containing protein n=1 Tax=Hermanssonia centrifuga TaxID=98765 RepID=A0A4S4KND2_9APHY|nr:hypothetical protein EW026_g2429 [Hermanssonia centrifuga]